MKKLFKIFTLVLLVVSFVFAMAACTNNNGESANDKGILCTKYGNDTFFTVYDYVDDGVTSSLDIDAAVKAKYGAQAEVGKIKSGAFQDNESLSEIIVPNSVTEIAEGAFRGIKKLKKLTIPFVGKTIESDAFIGESVSDTRSIDKERTIYHLFGKDSYEYGSSISFNNGGESETYYIPAMLETITVSNSTQYSIPAYAFNGLSIVGKIVLSGNIDAIGEFAFANCRALNSINVPSTVKTIYNNAFEGCENLKYGGLVFDANSTLVEIRDKAFIKTALTTIELPSSVETIGNYCFQQSALESIILSANLKTIGAKAFYGCENLVKVDNTAMIFTEGTSIGVAAFENCAKLDADDVACKLDLTKFAFVHSTAFNGTK